ncbi:MAG: alpha/beta fold hydrolase [Burkholderiales bacterium]
MMESMRQQTVRANGLRLILWSGGEAQPVVLLYGYPHGSLMWRKITPALLEELSSFLAADW